MQEIKLPKRYKVPGIDRVNSNKIQLAKLKEFDAYQREHYKMRPVACPCANQDDVEVSSVDRTGYSFPLVVCRRCGLVRAREYWHDENISDFYANWYRNTYWGMVQTPEQHYVEQAKTSSDLFNFVASAIGPTTRKILDIGGGTGGRLNEFVSRGYECYVLDFDPAALSEGEKMGIRPIVGGIHDIENYPIKFDLIILSHVFEHFVDLNHTLKILKNRVSENGLVFIEVPSIDSVVDGRRGHDFLLEIQNAHVYYFTVKTLKNVVERNGFTAVKMDREIRSIFSTADAKANVENFFSDTVDLLSTAEKKRTSLPFVTRKWAGKILRATGLRR